MTTGAIIMMVLGLGITWGGAASVSSARWTSSNDSLHNQVKADTFVSALSFKPQFKNGKSHQ